MTGAAFLTALNFIVAVQGLRIVSAPIESGRPGAPASSPSLSAHNTAQRRAAKPPSIPQTRPTHGRLTPSPAPSPSVTEPPRVERPRAPGENPLLERLPSALRAELVWWRFGFVELIILGLLVAALFMNRLPGLTDAVARPTAIALFAAQLVMISAGFVGAVGRAWFVEPRTDGVFVPNLDATTVLWLALIPIGMLLPRLQKVGIGGVSVELVDSVVQITTDVASLLEKWLSALNLLMQWLPADTAPGATIRAFLRDRGDEAVRQMSGPGEHLRLSFWAYVEEDAALTLLQSNQIDNDDTRRLVFRNGEGCLGMAYREQRCWNEENPRELACWKHDPGESKDYNGLLLVPIVWGKRKIGMLAVDHEEKAKFKTTPVQIAQALAYVAAQALGSPIAEAALERERLSRTTGNEPPS